MRFEVFNLKEAFEKNFPGIKEYEGTFDPDDEMPNGIWEMQNLQPYRLIAIDGGEPEDQSFTRSLSWIVDALELAYDDGYYDGEEVGQRVGYDEGRENAYNEGYYNGHEQGYWEGQEAYKDDL